MIKTIWNYVFEFFDMLTDNVYLVILFISIMAALILFLSQIAVSRLTKKEICITFGPLSMMITYAVAYMTTHLPVLHPRMNLALSTVAGIIQSSSTYSENFESASKVTITGSESIASYLYYLTEAERNTWKCRPGQIYDSLFRTMDQIRGGVIVPDVNMPCFGTFNVIFVAAMVVIVLMGVVLILNSHIGPIQIIWYFVSSLFLIWMCTISGGAAICAMVMWMSSTVLWQLKHN